MTSNVRKRVILYRSLFFKPQSPLEVSEFEEVRFIDAVDGDLDASLTKMRSAMIGSHNFDAAVFLGGMEGVETEYDTFRRLHPNRPAYPVASTGAAARILLRNTATTAWNLGSSGFWVVGGSRNQEDRMRTHRLPARCRPVTGRRGIIRIETNGILWKLFRRPQRVCPLACGFYLFPKTIQILIPVVSGKIYALRYRRFGSTRGR